MKGCSLQLPVPGKRDAQHLRQSRAARITLWRALARKVVTG